MSFILYIFLSEFRRLQKNSRNEDSDSGVLPSKHSSERIQPGKERHEYANTKGMAKKDSLLKLNKFGGEISKVNAFRYLLHTNSQIISKLFSEIDRVHLMYPFILV